MTSLVNTNFAYVIHFTKDDHEKLLSEDSSKNNTNIFLQLPQANDVFEEDDCALCIHACTIHTTIMVNTYYTR